MSQQMAELPDFAEIVREHQSLVFSLALRSLGDRATAEDVTQEVFLALHENLGRIESPGHIRHWLLRVASNRCIDEVRRRRYRRGPALEEVPEPRARSVDGDMLLQKHLRQSVAALPPKARVMVLLRYQEDLDYGEIARLLEIRVETVKSRLHRAVNLLRERVVRRLAAAGRV
jgi:RNA polymerase sigma-70 factor (ECF subfamily)